MAYKIIGYLKRDWSNATHINHKNFNGYALYMTQEISDLIEEEHEGFGAYDFLISLENLAPILEQKNWTMHDLINKDCKISLYGGSGNFIEKIYFI